MAIGLELNNVAARPRKSPFPMITVKDAQETVLKYCKNRPLDTETIDFMDAINRYSMQFEGIHKPRGQLKGGGGYLETWPFYNSKPFLVKAPMKGEGLKNPKNLSPWFMDGPFCNTVALRLFIWILMFLKVEIIFVYGST